jgi:uncharacterized protein YukE
MAYTGMDIVDVRQTGNELKQISGEIQGLMQRLDGRVNGTAWEGPDAQRFKNDWWPKHRTTLNNIVQELEGLGQSALNNAQEQETASS